MRTSPAGVMSVLAHLAVAALVMSSCGGGSSTSGSPGRSSAQQPSTTAPAPAPSGSASGTTATPVRPEELLTAGDLASARVAAALVQVKQAKHASAADQRKVFDCMAVPDLLARVPGASVEAKDVRAFTDARRTRDVAQVVLHFASPAQAQRFGGAVARRLAACPHPKLLVAGTGPEVSNLSTEQVSTACDRSGGFTAIATRRSTHGSNSLVVAMLLVAAGPRFSLTLLLGPLSSNNPVLRSKVADAVCARLRR